MKAPTLILMDVDQHAGLPSPRSLREFQRLFPGDAACAEYLERVRWGAASSVRIVASLVSRFESRPALTPSVRCSASLATQRRRPMPSFIPATGITLHLAGVCVNRIGVAQITNDSLHVQSRIICYRNPCELTSGVDYGREIFSLVTN